MSANAKVQAITEAMARAARQACSCANCLSWGQRIQDPPTPRLLP